jgi:hypothetical protein
LQVPVSFFFEGAPTPPGAPIGNRTDIEPFSLGNFGDDRLMSPRADEYRARAVQCEERAKRARDPEVKRQYQELAHQWLEMANQADRQNL